MNESSIGIIGGADGPTAIFVSGNPMWLIVYLAAAVLAVYAFVRLIKKLAGKGK